MQIADPARWIHRGLLGTVRRLDYALAVGIVLVLPHFFWPGATEYNYARCVFMLIAAPILVVVHLGAAASRGERKLQVPWIALPLLSFVLVSLVSLVHAASGRVVLESLAVAVSFCLFGLVVVDIARRQR